MPSKKSLLKELREAHAEIDKLTDCIGLMQQDIEESLSVSNVFFSNPYLRVVSMFWIEKMIAPLKRAKERWSDFCRVPF